MSRIIMQVTLTFTADILDGLSEADIIDNTDFSVVGDGDNVEVYGIDIEDFGIIDSK